MKKNNPNINNKKFARGSGILLHISSLSGKYGIGTMGEEAFNFIEFLKKSGQRYWQILPITPTLSQFGYSPYSSYSSFAGEPLLISEDEIIKKEWCDESLKDILPERINEDFIDFERVEDYKYKFLRAAFESFLSSKTDEIELFDKFKEDESGWLDDFSLFAALAEENKTYYWLKWDKVIRERESKALLIAEKRLKNDMEFWKFTQYLFFSQWAFLKKKANDEGIEIIGDIPIYVNFDSVDTWANPEIFQLNDKNFKPERVSGVPPDYFSKNGQKWGNPLYKWFSGDEINKKTYSWWKKRFKHLLKSVDIVRIDHFRGFEAYWAVPARAKTAIKGKWEKGPGEDFFLKLENELGKLPLIAEDLGIITKEVEKLRDDLGYPGMKILQFAFDFNPENIYLPCNFKTNNCIVYTGTHDNNTTNGWFYGDEVNEERRKYILDYIGIDNWDEFHWKFIRLAMSSIAVISIFPMQDVLGFSEKFRTNTPGENKKNWRWKLAEGKGQKYHSDMLLKLTKLYNRYSSGVKK